MNENVAINALLIAIVALGISLVNAWKLARRPASQPARPKPCATLAPISHENTQYRMVFTIIHEQITTQQARGLDPIKTLGRIKRLIEDSKIILDLEGERHA